MTKQKKDAPIYILDGVRTIVGNPNKSLKSLTAADLATGAINDLLRRSKIKKGLVDEVVLGNVVSAGSGQNIARQAALGCGLSKDVSAYRIDAVCGAGLQSVILGARSIKAGDNQLVIAGGAESASKSPYLVKRDDVGIPEEINVLDSIFSDGLFCRMTNKSMGEIVEAMAKKYKISRQEQDEYSLLSHVKAYAAHSQGYLKSEIVPLAKSHTKDDRPRKNINLESLQGLPPAFKARGSVTAGNSSVACDGAAAVLLASEKFVKKHKLKPRAKILNYTTVGVDPKKTFESSVKAVEACLKGHKLSIDDIDLFEIGEAFSAQMIYVQKRLNIKEDKLNIFGGDIAFGHPLGAAGTRILVTLINALKTKKLKTGCASICYGGGGALAMLIEAM